jgi:acetyltransferase-like isoleucine patch superfamily enzyme
MSYIGLKANIGDNITIPSGTVIPEGAEITRQEDVVVVIAKEKEKLSEKKAELATLFGMRTAI